MSTKTNNGINKFVCGVAFKDHTWGYYSQNATTDTEAQLILREYFDNRIKNGNGFNEDSATVMFMKVIRVDEVEDDFDPEDDWFMKPTKIMVAKPVSNTDYNDDLDDDDDEIYDLEDDVHND